MPRRYRKHKSYGRHKTHYRPMNVGELKESRRKLGIEVVHKNKEICKRQGCFKPATGTCKFCGMGYCNYHSDQSLVINLNQKGNMAREDDPVKYDKYMKDWGREDGHPCPGYTVWWNRDHEAAKHEGWSDHASESRPAYVYNPTRNTTYTNGPETATTAKSSNGDKNHTAIIVAVLAIAILVLGFLTYYNSHTGNLDGKNTSLNQTVRVESGTQTNPFMPNENDTITWNGPGYYSIPLNIPATGLRLGVNLLSNQGQASTYNYWVNLTYTSTSVITTSTTTSTTSSSTIVTTSTISEAAQNAAWATQFFENLSSERGSQYMYCPSLSQFAAVRFNTMASNYGISHYGYDQDFSSFYGTIYDTAFAEEVFYPNLGLLGDTPNSYTSQIQSTAPLHWQLLVNNTFDYYGYHIQNGPTYAIYGPDGGYAECPVTEIPGPNINIQQFFAQYGCTVATSNETWFVIEIASACP